MSDVSLDRVDVRDKVIALLCGAMLVIAPLYLGGNRPLPLLILELSACALILAIGAQLTALSKLSRLARLWLIALIALPAVYLIPVPFSQSGALLYEQVHALVGMDSPWRTLTMVPVETERSWYALVPACAVFVALFVMPARYVWPLVMVAVAVAAGEALLGIAQYLLGPASVLRLGITNYPDSAIGTFANRNHLAGLLEMALPIALALLVSASVQAARPRDFSSALGWSAWTRQDRHLWASAVVVLLLLVGLVLTRSRTGVAMAMIGTFASGMAFVRAGGVRPTVRPLASIAAIGVVVLLLLGLIPILTRFLTLDPLNDVRWTVFARTTELAGLFFPLGSGPGTFAAVFPRVQPPDLRYLVNHAHNDYLEWLVEVGIFAILFVAGFIVLFCQRGWVLLRQRRETRDSSYLVQIGAGISIILIALHSLVDFNLRIPANQIFFAFWSGLFFRTGWGRLVPPKGRREPSVSPAPWIEPLGVRTPPPGVKNPFCE